jgi:hypothetical protein
VGGGDIVRGEGEVHARTGLDTVAHLEQGEIGLASRDLQLDPALGGVEGLIGEYGESKLLGVKDKARS